MGLKCAIDGPSGAGKSTIAKTLAQKIGFIYVDTGALYRAIGLYALRKGVITDIPEQVVPLLDEIKLDLRHENNVQRVFLNGEDVSDLIRTQEISMAASDVSAFAEVRQFLIDLQREIAANNDVIMDGRDIGTVILPDAEVKVFLTASPEERARRRFEELKARSRDVEYEKVLSDINRRDYNDSHREISPLRKADDAIELDSTGMEVGEVVDRVEELIDAARRREFKTIPAWRRVPYALLRGLAALVFGIIFDVRYEGRENLPKSGSVILAGNHRTWFDPVLIAIRVKYISSYMAKSELFEIPVLRTIIKIVHAFPTRRNSADVSSLSVAEEYIRKGYNLTIFPEGTRSRDGKIGRARSGVAVIASRCGVPVYPVGIAYKGHLRFRRRITVRFGEPISPEELKIASMSKTDLRAAGDRIMAKIAKLVETDV